MCFITVYVRMISYNISRYLFNQLQNKTNHYGLKLNTGNNHNNQEKKSVRVGLHYESPKCLGCSYTSLQQITLQLLNQFCVYLLLCPVFFFSLQWNNQLPRFTVAPRFFTPSLKGTTFRSADQPELTTCHWLPQTFKTECDRLAQLGGKTRTRFPYIHVNMAPCFSQRIPILNFKKM